MIHKNTPLSMAEALEYIKEKREENTELIGFIKKFNELKKGQVKEIKDKINELKMLKVKEEHIVKIIDLLPDISTDLNKIFEDVNLDEDETNKIIDIIKQYK